MSITAEEKKKYFAETALALSRAGFHVEEIPDNKLGVWLDEQPLCEVGEVGGITYRSDNISTPERMTEKDCPSGFDLTYEQETCIKSVQEQIKDRIPDITDHIWEQD